MPNTVANQQETWLHVVAAVIYGLDGKILLSKRLSHQHQGGKWEFPGGKVETDESPQTALARELHEELGIQVDPTHMQPLIQVRHRYPEKNILLDVWEVHWFTGKPMGKEGQEVAWFNKSQLQALTFPDANKPIVTAALLPSVYLITPEPDPEDAYFSEFLEKLEHTLKRGIKLIQLRVKSLEAEAWKHLANQAIRLCNTYDAQIILNTPQAWMEQADGLHLTSDQLLTLDQRPNYLEDKWLTAAVHNEQELLKAQQLGVDFICVSPIQATQSHPEVEPLGLEQLTSYCQQANMPVFALGGMQLSDTEQAKCCGAQGIAAIRSLWDV